MVAGGLALLYDEIVTWTELLETHDATLVFKEGIDKFVLKSTSTPSFEPVFAHLTKSILAHKSTLISPTLDLALLIATSGVNSSAYINLYTFTFEGLIVSTVSFMDPFE